MTVSTVAPSSGSVKINKLLNNCECNTTIIEFVESDSGIGNMKQRLSQTIDFSKSSDSETDLDNASLLTLEYLTWDRDVALALALLMGLFLFLFVI